MVFSTFFDETVTLWSVGLFHNSQIGDNSNSNAEFVASKDDVAHVNTRNAIDTNVNWFTSREQMPMQFPKHQNKWESLSQSWYWTEQ